MNTLLCVYKKLFFLGDEYSKKLVTTIYVALLIWQTSLEYMHILKSVNRRTYVIIHMDLIVSYNT